MTGAICGERITKSARLNDKKTRRFLLEKIKKKRTAFLLSRRILKKFSLISKKTPTVLSNSRSFIAYKRLNIRKALATFSLIAAVAAKEKASKKSSSFGCSSIARCSA